MGQPAEALAQTADFRVVEVDGEEVGQTLLSSVTIDGETPRLDCAGLAPLGAAPFSPERESAPLSFAMQPHPALV